MWHATAEAGETPPLGLPVEESFQDAIKSVKDLNIPFPLVLADADNGFNNLSHLNMLWDVRHHRACSSCFAFIMYRHDA